MLRQTNQDPWNTIKQPWSLTNNALLKRDHPILFQTSFLKGHVEFWRCSDSSSLSIHTCIVFQWKPINNSIPIIHHCRIEKSCRWVLFAANFCGLNGGIIIGWQESGCVDYMILVDGWATHVVQPCRYTRTVPKNGMLPLTVNSGKVTELSGIPTKKCNNQRGAWNPGSGFPSQWIVNAVYYLERIDGDRPSPESWFTMAPY